MHYIPTNDDWRPVSSRTPCPICGGDHRCDLSSDGAVVKCYRQSAGAFKTDTDTKGEYHVHRLRDDRPAPASTRKAKPKPATDWEGVQDRCAAAVTYPQVEALSYDLFVTIASLYDLGVGWDGSRGVYTFPEQDAERRVVGLSTRTIDGEKRFLPGGKRGLVIPDSLELAGADTLLIVEGVSDVAACITLGIPAIGRPSNRGGVDLLADLLGDYRGEILVVGENDQKPGGEWPGREGAVHVSTELATRLGRLVQWTLPPHGTKDLRSWLADHDAHLTEELREVLL